MKVPKFKNVKEERKFWDTHESTDYLDDFEEVKDVVFVRPKKQVISLRLEPHVINKRIYNPNEGIYTEWFWGYFRTILCRFL